MDESGLEYPDDDMDRMLDDELEIMRDIENEQNKENEPARRSLEFGSSGPKGDSVISSSLKPFDTNVGIGKRARSPEEFDEIDEEDFFNSIDSAAAQKRLSPRGSTPSSKRMKPDVLADSNRSSQGYRIPRLGDRKIYRKLPDFDFQAVTLASGDRFYLRMRSEEAKLEPKLGTNLQPVGLCGVPFHQLQEQAAKELGPKPTQQNDAASDSGIESGEEDSQTQLWVEKFKPRKYTDLLSDHGTNRVLLQWLKLWDKLVFNKEKAKKPPKPEDDVPKFQSFLPEVVEELDSSSRPQQKVALLHGPPGLGKTTLAHIVALHAGYKVVEMNASDDRSVDAFKRNLEAATQMKSVISKDQRPNCLIIDEIDGAPPATINYLVSILSGKQQQGKKKKAMQVLRPIICICNELYTPALRPLKQMAFIIPFPPTATNRLATRLKEITNREKFKTDLTTLLALCKKTDNDIRSCLSTLQFCKKKGKILSSDDISKMSVGMKDSQKSMFSVWAEIFSVPSTDDGSKRRTKDATNKPVGRFGSILSAVASCGESDRIITGVFENYLNIQFKDSDMSNIMSGLDWFSHFDILQQEILHSQNYSMMGHLYFPIVASHYLFASVNKPKISFPTQMSDLRNRLTQTTHVVESVMGEMLPKTRAYCSRSTLVRDLLPALLAVIQPVLRPVNTQLYSAKEKAELKNLVNIHIAYNITYQQQRNMEGQYEYKMDPDVESVVAFPDISRTVQLTYASKQLIAHEIELEKMRRVDIMNAKNATSSQQKDDIKVSTPSRKNNKFGGGTPSREKNPSGGTESNNTPSHLATLTPKPIVIKERKAMDFFGRVIEVSEKMKKSTVVNNEIVKTDVWFRFKEGFSNAVRRNVKMKDLL